MRCGRRAGVLRLRVRIEVHPVQVRVQRRLLRVARALHGDPPEPVVPRGPRGIADVIEGSAGYFEIEVVRGLIDGQERRRDPQQYLGIRRRVERGGRRRGRRRRTVERRRDEHPAAPDRKAAAVVDPAGHRVARPDGERAVVEDEAAGGLSGREREAHDPGVVGRRHLGDQPALQHHPVVVGLRDLGVVAERQPARARRAGQRTTCGHRHHRHLVAVAHPRARLVRDAKSLQHRHIRRVVHLLVHVLPRVRPGVGHRGEEVEPVGQRRGREVVAARERPGRVGAPAGVDVVRQARRVNRGRRALDVEVVDPALEAGGRRRAGIVVGEQHAVDRLARGDRPDVGLDVVPLVGVEHLRGALTGRRQRVAVLIGRRQRAQVAAVGEMQIDRGIGRRVLRVAAGEFRKDLVGQAGLRAHRDVDVVELVGLERPPVGPRTTRIAQRRDAGESGRRLHVEPADRTGADGGDHRRSGRLGVRAVGDVPVGQLRQAVTGVRGDVEAVEAVRRRIRQRVLVRHEAAAECLAGTAVEVGPRRAVVAALQGEVLRVAAGRVVRGGQRVHGDDRRGRQLVGDPARRDEGEPLRRRVAVGQVGGHLVGRVLGAGRHGGDLRQQAARQATRGGAAQIALNGIAVAVQFNRGRRRLRIGRLERGREVAGCRRRSGNRRAGRDDRPDEDQRPEAGDEATPAVVLASRGPRSLPGIDDLLQGDTHVEATLPRHGCPDVPHLHRGRSRPSSVRARSQQRNEPLSTLSCDAFRAGAIPAGTADSRRPTRPARAATGACGARREKYGRSRRLIGDRW